jgi:hypothetical protein
MDNVVFLITLLGLLINPLTSLAKQDHWPQSVKAGIAILLSAVGGVVIVATQGGLHGFADPANWALCASAVYAASQVIYHGLFKDNPLDKVLTALPSKPAPNTIVGGLVAPDVTPFHKGEQSE